MATEQPSPSAKQHTPICPRCGYDQSGAVASWEDRCPMTGRCSECGLEFWWRQVLGEQVLGPAWSIEHGQRLSLKRLARAFMRGVFQGRLWRRAELGSFMRPRRLWLLIALSLAVNHVVLAGVIAVSTMVTRSSRAGPFGGSFSVAIWLNPYGEYLEVPRGGWWSIPIPVWPLCLITGVAFLVPIMVIQIFTQTMSRVGVRRVHILRGAAYMLPAVGPVTVVGLALIGTIVAIKYNYIVTWKPLLLVIALGMAIGCAALQVLRWRAFVRYYLRLPHSNGIAASMGIILILSLVLTILQVASTLAHS